MSQKPGIVVTLPFGMQFSEEDLQVIDEMTLSFKASLLSIFGDRPNQDKTKRFAQEIRADGTFVSEDEIPAYVKALGLPPDLKGRKVVLSFRDCGPDQTEIHRVTARIGEVKVRRGFHLELHLEDAPSINLRGWGMNQLEPLHLALTKSLGRNNIEDGEKLWSLDLRTGGWSSPTKDLQVGIL